jgi:hypothetical protein
LLNYINYFVNSAIEEIVDLDIRTEEIENRFTAIMVNDNDKEEGVRLYVAEALLRLGYICEKAFNKLLGQVSEHLENYRLAALYRVYESGSFSAFNREDILRALFRISDKCESTIPKLQAAELLIRISANDTDLEKILNDYERKQTAFLIIDSLRHKDQDTRQLAQNILIRNRGKINEALICFMATLLFADFELGKLVKEAMSLEETPSLPIDCISLALRRPPLKNEELKMVGSILGLGISGSGIILYTGIRAAIGVVGRKTTFGAIAIGSIFAYNMFFNYVSSTELDKIAPSKEDNKDKEKDKLKAICGTVNNDLKAVMAWSREGILDLKLAIQLYSCSSGSQTAWLEPMKDIVFIYKNPKAFFTICHKSIDYHECVIKISGQEITENTDQTKAVLGAMREAYRNAKLSTNLINHYLNGTSLDTSTKEEKRQLEQRRIEFAIKKLQEENQKRLLEYTALHIAAQGGDIEKVIEILDQGQIDIDDQHNETGDTALMLAVKNKHWEIVKLLVEGGADIAFYNKNGHNAPKVAISNFNHAVNYLIGKCCLKEARLQKLLDETLALYIKAKSNLSFRDEIIANLAALLINQKSNWKEDIVFLKRHRMYLDDALEIVLDHQCVSETINMKVYSSIPHEHQKVRLYTYLELYMRLCAGLATNLPKNGSRDYYDLQTVCNKLRYEIKILLNSIAFTHGLTRLGNKDIGIAKAETVLEKLRQMPGGDEFVITSGDKRHTVYVALCKLDKQRILIRVDNRLLNYSILSSLHGKEPYSIVLDVIEENHDIEARARKPIVKRKVWYIKSYCVGIADLDVDFGLLKEYIAKVIVEEDLAELKYRDIYGVYLPASITTLSAEINSYIASWPYYPQQTGLGQNCNTSSYNMGLLVRHEKEFCKWLIKQELAVVSSLTPEDRSFVDVANKNRVLDYTTMPGFFI